jgi:hypothetical protein
MDWPGNNPRHSQGVWSTTLHSYQIFVPTDTPADDGTVSFTASSSGGSKIEIRTGIMIDSSNNAVSTIQ